jgi:cytochrome c oxidase subunit 2
VITGWFEPTMTGEHDIQCAEICGIGHGLMPARIHIESPEQHAAWVESNSPLAIAGASDAGADPAEGSAKGALAGRTGDEAETRI